MNSFHRFIVRAVRNLFHPRSHLPILYARLRRVSSFLAWPLLAPLARIRRNQLRDSVSIIAVVGSFGKTTTARTLGATLSCPSVSGRNSWSHLALGLLRLGKNEEFAVFEAAVTTQGQMSRYAKLLQPDVSIVTSIGSEHLLSMRTLEATRREKAQMVEATSPDGFVVLNGDDPNVLWMRDRTKARVVTYGFGEANDVRARDFGIVWPDGSRFRIDAANRSWEVTLPLIGRTMAYPALAAVAVGLSKGLDIKGITDRLKGLKPAPGRLEPLELPNGSWVLRDDHKSAIETIHAAISTLKEINAPRRIAVMGDITEETGNVREAYRNLGAEIAAIVDLLLLTGRHARSMAVGAHGTGMASEAVIDCGKDIFNAARILQSRLMPGDVVLLKGRYEQRLARVALEIAGKSVNCRLKSCQIKGLQCESCPALTTGWPSSMVEI